MKSDNLVGSSCNGHAPRLRVTTSVLVTVCAVAIGVALSLVIRLNLNPAVEYDELRRDSDISSGSGKFAASLESSVPAASSSAGLASEMQSPATSAPISEPQFKQPSGNLIAAIKGAQAKRDAHPVSPPIGQSWQGMSPREAATTFEVAVKAATASSALSPFGGGKGRN